MKWENGSAFCFTKQYQAMAEYQYLYLLVLFYKLIMHSFDRKVEVHDCLVEVVGGE